MEELGGGPADLAAIPPGPSGPVSLAHNAAWQLGSTAVRGAAGLVSVALYTRFLGMSQWGLLALVQAVVAPLVLFDAFGWAAVKYVAEALGRRDRHEATRVVQATVALNVVVGTLGALALVAGARWFATSVFVVPPADVERSVLAFRLVAATWLAGVLSTTFAAVLVAHQAYGVVARLAVLSVVLSATGGVAAAWLWHSAAAVVLAQAAAGAVMVLVHFDQARRRLPGIAAVPRWDAATARRLLSFGGWQLLATGGALLAAWGDRYVLATAFVPTVVGFYAVAQHLTGQLQSAFVEMGDVLFPAVSHLHGEGDLPSARRLVLRGGWSLTLAFGVCATTLGVVGGDFLALWISPEAAREAQAALRLMCAGGMLWVTAIAPMAYVVGTGRIRWEALTNLASGLVLLAVSLVLVPRLGLAGVGYGLIAASLVRAASVLTLWRTDFAGEHRLSAFAVSTWSPALVGIASLAVLAIVGDGWTPSGGWTSLLVEAGLVLVGAGAVQLASGEALPGGAGRRRQLIETGRAVIARVLGVAPTGPS